MIRDVRKGQVFAYVALPQFLPRLRGLFANGFEYIPYFIALVYAAVRLLPSGHPYTNASNIGRFGLRQVIAAAANNIVLSVKHIDQILLFTLVLIGMVMMILQFFLLGVGLFVQPVFAASNFTDLFVTQAPLQDLAFIMLDMVFGVPGMFDSCVSTGGGCLNAEGGLITATSATIPDWGYQPGTNFPTPMHHGLHRMFHIYSMGLLVVASIIFIYMIITVLAETMQTGTAFGKRYNHVWAPIRMVVAFGLLIPIGVGLNTSQYLVLYAAKFGSSFATNGWLLFNTNLANNALAPGANGGYDNLVAEPNAPEYGGLLQFVYTATTCYFGEQRVNPTRGNVGMYLIGVPGDANAWTEITDTMFYSDIITAAGPNVSKLVFRFGYEPDQNGGSYGGKAYSGTVAPICGEVVIPLTDSRPEADQEPAIRVAQQMHVNWLKEYWFGEINGEVWSPNISSGFIERKMPATGTTPPPEPSTQVALDTKAQWDNVFGLVSNAVAVQMATSNRWNMEAHIRDKGWAGSAIWYNRIAEMNGILIDAIGGLARPTKYPMVMEKVYAEKRKTDGTLNFAERFKPESESTNAPRDVLIAIAYWDSFYYWEKSGAMEGPHSKASGNVMRDIINALLGTEGLFNMRDNPDIHPLAQLSAVGRSLIESSMRNLSNAAVGGVGGALASQISKFVGIAAGNFSSALVSFAMIALMAGFVLFYIVPFLPFIYFAFAFGGWVKGIFEAMVGAPLWALAHIRIDGHGLSGQAAISGYFLIFEIFLRPILMVFGLIASVSIFSALVYVLNLVFDLVVSNVGGFDVDAAYKAGGNLTDRIGAMRDEIDEFFFTVLYVVIVYLMGMSSFKLIDLIPNNILRWMGQSISTFNDAQENAAENLVGKTTQGAQQATSAIGGGLKQLTKLGGG